MSNSSKYKVFTSVYNEALHEYAVFINGDIFCHLSEIDYDIFVKNFAFPVKLVGEI
jgi:hypothetical protein